MIDDEVGKYRKKSTAKGQPRSKHKHIYETVLLTKYYEGHNFKTGKPQTTEYIDSTRVCVICGRIDRIDRDSSYYTETACRGIPYISHTNELSDKALKLPRWFAGFFDKFASKVEDK